MSFRFVDSPASSDIAIEAEAATLEGMLRSCWEALTSTMVRNPEVITPSEKYAFSCRASSADMLLYDLLEEQLFLKDAKGVICLIDRIELGQGAGSELSAKTHLLCESLDTKKHVLGVDVKAITLYRLSVSQVNGVWRSMVILDV